MSACLPATPHLTPTVPALNHIFIMSATEVAATTSVAEANTVEVSPASAIETSKVEEVAAVATVSHLLRSGALI